MYHVIDKQSTSGKVGWVKHACIQALNSNGKEPNEEIKVMFISK